MSRSVARFYVERLGRVFHGVPRLVAFALASAMHAIGHALVALVAGAVALSMTQGMAHLSNVLGARPPSFDFSGAPIGDGLSADRALFLSAVGLAVVLVKGAAGAYAGFVQARVAGEVGSELRLELLDALLTVHRLHCPRHGDHGSSVGGTAQAVAALTERVREVEAGLEQGLLGGARAVAQLVPIAALLVVLSGRMALVAALVLAAFGWVLGRIRGGYRSATRRAGWEREELLEAADEAVRYADLWVTYGAEANVRRMVLRLGDAIAGSAARLQARAALLSGANEVLGAAALVVAIAATRRGWLGAAPDGKTLFLFALVFFLAYRPLREIAEARLSLARAQGAFEGLDEVIGGATSASSGSIEGGLPVAGASASDVSGALLRPASLERPAAPAPWPLAGLELRGLRLARGGGESLTLRVEAGSIVVLAGPTGIGKTTLLRTLLGLDRAAGGDVLFGGESLRDAPAGPSSRPFVWVPQDAPLLADSLAANVTLGAPAADARRTLDGLGAGHLVSALGDGRLGAGGRAVSGGERQWIALARAIATEQPVLLLDEPTSGLDAESQRRVLAAIARLRGKRTVLLVTHRPEPMAIADVVVRLDARGAIEKAA